MIIVILHDTASGQVILKAEGATGKEHVQKVMTEAMSMLDNEQGQNSPPQPAQPVRPPQLLIPRPGVPNNIRNILPQGPPK
jgi:hypothetical protein